MLAPNALMTFADVQPLLGLDSSLQAKYEWLISLASQYAEDFTGRNLCERTYTNFNLTYEPGYDYNIIILPEFPLISVASLNFDPLHMWGPSTLVTGYELDLNKGLIYCNPNTMSPSMSIPTGYRDILITYSAGYQLDVNVPYTLQQAIVELTKWYDTRLGGQFIGQRYTNFEGLNTSFEITSPAHVINLLTDYKRIA